MTDPITEECRRVRDQIVARSGGREGYFDQLEEADRKRLAEHAGKLKAAKKAAAATTRRAKKRPD